MNNDIKGRMYCNCELANGTSLKDISEAFVCILPKAFISVQCRCHFILCKVAFWHQMLCFHGGRPYTAGGQHKTRLWWGSAQDKAVVGKRLALIASWDSYVKDSLNSACEMTPSEMEDSRRKFCSGYLHAQESPHALHPVKRSGRELSGTVFTHSL